MCGDPPNIIIGTALGYTPAGMEQGFSFDALFPDYAIAGLPDAFGYILSALIGTALKISSAASRHASDFLSFFFIFLLPFKDFSLPRIRITAILCRVAE